MSGVYVKGMKMPYRCCECKLKYWDGEEDVCPFVGMIVPIGRHDACPLILVRDHGDLIDVDAGIDIRQGQIVPQRTTIRRFLLNHVDGLLPIVVIPADEEDENGK